MIEIILKNERYRESLIAFAINKSYKNRNSKIHQTHLSNELWNQLSKIKPKVKDSLVHKRLFFTF
ncbi:MAG: hypothetical protein DI535_08850 [Citrobacter freundii]|nr:MAG: hypothetical protein DI535_08850 [Citrobacter freundii]